MSCDKREAAELGKQGEARVANYLKSKGCIIVKRNWRDSRFGEIDIIAEDDKNIIFVEVKTRTSGAKVSGVEAVDAFKMRRVRNAAEIFMQRLNTQLEPRIDVAEVTVSKNTDGREIWKLNYIKSAF